MTENDAASIRMDFGGTLRKLENGRWTYDWYKNGVRTKKSTRQRDFQKAVEVARRLSAAQKMTERWFGNCYESDYFEAFSNTRKNAKRRAIAFSLSLDDLRTMVERCGGACELTGIPFQRVRNIGPFERQPFMPSIDRIDSSLGYTMANVRLLCTAANLAINTWGDWVLIELARCMNSRLARAEKQDSALV